MLPSFQSLFSRIANFGTNRPGLAHEDIKKIRMTNIACLVQLLNMVLLAIILPVYGLYNFFPLLGLEFVGWATCFVLVYYGRYTAAKSALYLPIVFAVSVANAGFEKGAQTIVYAFPLITALFLLYGRKEVRTLYALLILSFFSLVAGNLAAGFIEPFFILQNPALQVYFTAFTSSQALLLTILIVKGFFVESYRSEQRYIDIAREVAIQAEQLAAQRDKIDLQRQELSKAHDELQKIDELKTAFFRQISHELRTPLTLILGSLSLAERTEDWAPNTKVALRNSRRLLRLVNQLLDFQSLTQSKSPQFLVPIELCSVCGSIASLFAPSCRVKDIEFAFELQEADRKKGLRVLGKIDSFEKIIFNYLSNALKYTPPQGLIRFTLSVRAGLVRIEISDSGPGIPSQELDKLFQTFVRIKDPDGNIREGTGLGLALCRELAGAMQGQVGVQSHLGKGSTFWAEFPMVMAAASHSRPSIQDVLFVDDDESIQRSFLKAIETYTSIDRCVYARSFLEAQEALSSYRFRCVISDLNLRSPEGSGLDLLILASLMQPEAERIILSGDQSSETLQKAINDARVTRIIYKPCDYSQELSKIEELVRKSSIKDDVTLNEQDQKERTEIYLSEFEGPSSETVIEAMPALDDAPTLLLVDDQIDLRLLIKRILKAESFNIVEAHDGREAIEILNATDSRIDLVISDWMMPRMSGPDLVKAMKAENKLKSIPIILLTAKGDDEARSEATAYGANAYLSKPFDEADLVSTVKNLFTLKQKEKELSDMQRYLTEQVLQRYLPTKLVERIVQGTMQLDEAPRMEVVTIMFADICGFTSTTEALGSRKTAEILNTFLTEMTEVIFRHGGTIDKFIGDCILVIFGAPEKQPSQEQVIQARNCSLDMFKKLAEINEQWNTKNLPALKMRIGIHHGSALVGNFGGPQRSDYTAIGHTVNLASRVQAAADEDTILISQVVRDLLPDDEWEDAGSHKVKGVASEQRLYRVKKGALGKVA